MLGSDRNTSLAKASYSATGHLLESRFAGSAWLTGGSAGPEGSLLAFPVFLVVLALLWLAYRRKGAARA